MPPATFTSHLRSVLEDQQTLDRSQARDLLETILRGDANELQIAALLGALAARGETPAELAGFVDTMRSVATPYPDLTDAERSQLVDTCGTGGDASNTFNISTAAALVAAAAGAKVAKHGNRAVTSKCGSADVLEALGIPIQLSPEAATAALRRHNFAFLLAPAHHPHMRALMPVRKALGVRTILHILGPLLNPAGARRQVMGVYHPRLVPLVAEAMLLLGVHHALVVHGNSGADHASDGTRSTGLDELSLSGPTQIAELRDGTLRTFTVEPEAVGLTRAPLESLTGGDATLNAEILTAIFAGEPGPRRDIVLLNAAAVLLTSGIAANLTEGVARSAQSIDSGATTALVQSLIPNPWSSYGTCNRHRRRLPPLQRSKSPRKVVFRKPRHHPRRLQRRSLHVVRRRPRRQRHDRLVHLPHRHRILRRRPPAHHDQLPRRRPRRPPRKTLRRRRLDRPQARQRTLRQVRLDQGLRRQSPRTLAAPQRRLDRRSLESRLHRPSSSSHAMQEGFLRLASRDYLALDTPKAIHYLLVVDRLNTTFTALSDPTRRAMIERLSHGPASVHGLTEPFDLSQQMISKHIAYLVKARIVIKTKRGRESVCTLRPEAIKTVSDWAFNYRRFWEERLDKLDVVLNQMKKDEVIHGKQPAK